VLLLAFSTGSSVSLASQQKFKQVIDNVDTHVSSTLNKFKDIGSSEWYVSKVAKLVALGGINGYIDGTFKPNSTITQGEFIKIVVAVFDGEQPAPAAREHWAVNYLRRAEELEYVRKGDHASDGLDKPISRNQMSRIAARVAASRGETFLPNRADYIYQIIDYGSVPEDYRCPVLKAFTQGLISGYPDGKFKGDQSLTRAEASTVIVRLFDEAERKLPKDPVAVSETKKIDEAVSNPSAISKNFKVVNAQVYTVNPYETELFIGPTTTFVKVKGLNFLYIIQGDKVIQLMSSYPNPDGFRYHALPDNIKITEIDHFGAVEYTSDTMVIIPNPYK
jgi:hypothetical protein